MIQCKAEQQSNHESGGFVLPFFYLPKGSVGGMQWQRNEYLKFFSLLFLHSFGVNFFALLHNYGNKKREKLFSRVVCE